MKDSVVTLLHMLQEGNDDPATLAALIELSRDEDRDTRDWATFAIGQQTEIDSPEIREALFERTGEEDAEIRGEALIGLAQRKDARALPLVQEELRLPFRGDWAVEAAQLLADPSLVPLLEALRDRLAPEDAIHFQRSFRDAIEACQPR